MDNRELFALAADFRKMIDECYFLKDRIPFNWFPVGCCGTTCDLLAYYLKSKGIKGIHRVSARIPYHGIDDYTHQWLKVNSAIIDITADQFKEYSRPKVYVGDEDEFYSSFTITSSDDYDEDFELDDIHYELPWFYTHITLNKKSSS